MTECNNELDMEPSVHCFDTYKEWKLNGKLHRKDSPAVEYADGGKEWFINDIRHREGGPAIEYPNGDKMWIFNGKIHREDGPAQESGDGSHRAWWYHGENLTVKFGCTSQEVFERLLKIKAFW